MRSRRWTVTLNNPCVPLDALFQDTLMTYLVAGQETAPTTGTPHYQIYLETKTKTSLSSLRNSLETSWKSPPHLTASRGTLEQNKAYCLKEGHASIEVGTPMRPGARTDLEDVVASIASGASMRSLWIEYPSELIKYGNGIRAAYQALSPNMTMSSAPRYRIDQFHWSYPTADIQEVLGKKSVILWGPSGIGKTCYAKAILPTALFVSHMDDLLRYDQGTHDGIIFDDMSFMHLPREAQIHMFDCDEPRSIHCRYSVAMIPAGTKKIFTTNNDGGYIFNGGERAIERRVERFNITHDMNEVDLMEVEWN